MDTCNSIILFMIMLSPHLFILSGNVDHEVVLAAMFAFLIMFSIGLSFNNTVDTNHAPFFYFNEHVEVFYVNGDQLIHVELVNELGDTLTQLREVTDALERLNIRYSYLRSHLGDGKLPIAPCA